MFQFFRSRKQTFRIMLAVIVAPVIITMVVTLIPGIYGTSSGAGSDTVLAEVWGDEISVREAQYELQDYIRRQRVPPQAYGFLAPQIVQNLVTDQAMLHEAERLGLGVTEPELADLLKTSLPFLFQGGSFVGSEQYAAFVQDRFQKSVPEFEALLRKDLIMTKLRRLLTDGIVVTPLEVEQEYKRRKENVKIEFAPVSLASVEASVSSTPAEVEEFFKQNRSVYMLQQRRSFKYMVVDDAKIAAKIQVTPQELQRYYNENRDRFRVQDRARVTHILFKTTDKSPEEVKKIEAKAQDVSKQLRAGKDFAELAKANSDDTASAAKGGEIGWVTRGQTVPEFEQKAFSMKPGEISDLVKTQYGFHIIKVLERENAHLKTFQEVEPTIRQELTRDRSELERARAADRARAAASKYGPKLEEAGREAGLPVYTATLLERGSPIPELRAEPALTEALFSANKGSLIGPIQMAGKSVIAVVTDIAAAREAQLSEVADRVKADCNAASARKAAEARARELAAKAKAMGGDLRKAAKEFRLETKTSEFFNREGSIPGLGSAATVGEAFTAPVGSVMGPVIAGGDQVVYKVIEHQPADMSGFAGEKDNIRQMMLGSRQNEAFEVFKEDLREQMRKQGKIKIYQTRVDRFVSANRGG